MWVRDDLDQHIGQAAGYGLGDLIPGLQPEQRELLRGAADNVQDRFRHLSQ